MNPLIIDPLPSRPRLPFMPSFQDAVNLNTREGTSFYTAAFLFQGWISELTLANSAQLAEKPNPADRSFQTGEAWRGFLKIFGKTSDAEFAELFGHLMRFSSCDDPLAVHISQAMSPLYVEHQLTGKYLGRHTPPILRTQPKKLLALARSTIARLCDWIDSGLQFRVFHEWHIMPDTFDPDPQKRELTHLGHIQRHFDLLNETSQEHCLNHLSDAAHELTGSPKWSAFRQAASRPLPEPRPWPTFQLDRALIKIWPLVKTHHWHADDLLSVLRRVLKPDDLVPCPDAPSLITYCDQKLSLRYIGLKSNRAPAREPKGSAVALNIFASDQEPLPGGVR